MPASVPSWASRVLRKCGLASSLNQPLIFPNCGAKLNRTQNLCRISTSCLLSRPFLAVFLGKFNAVNSKQYFRILSKKPNLRTDEKTATFSGDPCCRQAVANGGGQFSPFHYAEDSQQNSI